MIMMMVHKWLYFLEPLGQKETLLLNYFLCAFR